MKLIAAFAFSLVAAAQVGPIAGNMPAGAPQAPGTLNVLRIPETRHVSAFFHPDGKLENVFYQVRIMRRGEDIKGEETWTPILGEPIEVFDGKVPKSWGDDIRFEVWMRKQSDGVITMAYAEVVLDPRVTLLKWPPLSISVDRGVMLATGFKSKPIVYVSGVGIVGDPRYVRFSGDAVQINIGAVPEFATFCSEGECVTYSLPAANVNVRVQ